jgi:predicted GIY-YIG superfamily endonuclease
MGARDEAMPTGVGALRRAARAAPRVPGVYLFVDGDGVLLYVGKAVDLGARLRQHAAGPGRRYDLVRAVAWEEHPSEGEAAAREADLIVALRPPLNRSHVDEGRWQYLAVEPGERAGHLRFTLSSERTASAARTYGCFPHLGAGLASRRGTACSDGYAALLRLLWSASSSTDEPVPTRLCRTAPPAAEIAVDPTLLDDLRRFLAGSDQRLLGRLAVACAGRPPYALPALARDRRSALLFFVHGPRALRDLRRRHRVRRPVLSREEIVQLLSTEVRAVIAAT